ncbi:MAG: DHH family phosphoesterase [Sphaerochaetaceae bacterium]|nr:DHH family phosphoesterase [Sphaerochaetaceae bacterium]
MKMNNRVRWILIVCLIISIIAIGFGGFFIGSNIEANHYKAEADFNIQLNRSELDGLGEIEGTIYVTGHKSPDTDTVSCSIAYASLLREMGYDAVPVVLGKLNHESEFVLKEAGLEAPMLLEDSKGLNMILVDHSEYAQSANNLNEANVIGIIDHHGVGSVTTGNPLIYDGRPLGSTATIVWIRYMNYGVNIDRQVATLMLGAILSDTKNLQSGTTTNADRQAAKALSEIAGVSDTDTFYQKMYKALISYDGMTDEEIFFSDYKEYEIGGKKVSVGCMNAYDEEIARDVAKRMKETMIKAQVSRGMDLSFSIIQILHDDISVSYFVPSNDEARSVLEAAFGDSVIYDGTSYIRKPYASRKSVFIPAIKGVLK